MVKLTVDLIEGAGQYINPIRDRELDLRKLDGFPYLRRVKTMLLNNNRIVRVGEDLQINLPHLETLMLTNNSIQVKDKEREAAKALFKTKEGKTQLKDIQRKARTFTPGDALPEATNKNTNAAGLTPEQVRNLKTMIAKASSLDEIERLNQMLRSGTMPGMKNGGGGGGGEEEMEEG